jgi:Kdo2-lipid IVA lauroyltransferase/acyltransferase
VIGMNAMPATARRWSKRIASSLKPMFAAVAGRLAVWLLRAIRRTDPDRVSDISAALLRRIGPFFPEHRTGRANLAAAYPEKSPAEIEAILRGVWDNLGRVAAEYAHLDRLWDFDPTRPTPGRIEIPPEMMERFFRLRDDGKPALGFAAHLGNWELSAVAAAACGMDSAVLYRAPNIGPVATAVLAFRGPNMGTLIPTGIGAPSAVAAALKRGQHVGMLVDQFFYQGVEVEFFGRRCKANPMIARLARHFDCPIHGTRVVRLPSHRFRIELTEPIVPPRDSAGQVDVQATTQLITTIVEGWVREHPEQWLWLHRRWR